MKFTDLELDSTIQTQLAAIGFTECTPVQENVIPSLLEGKDVSALAQTGTGKTAAFLLPLMDRILRSVRGDQHKEFANDQEREAAEKRLFKDWKKGHFALVLVPTRELAEQVYQDFKRFKGETGLEAVSIYGGTEYDDQRKKLSSGVHFVIGTPGRLIDLYKTHSLDLRQVRAVVFDEADRMFDMGFKDDMKFILQRVPKDRQILLFSATMNFDVMMTAYRFGSEPVEFNLSKDQVKAENVEDSIFHVGQEDKPKYLHSLIRKHSPVQLIVFSNFKSNVERIAKFLTKNGVPAMGISSLLTQAQRNRVITQFKEGKGQSILVATDVAARGLDIKGVDMVINFELPDDAENYVHRIGRTGRAGASGKAFSLVSDRDVDALTRIEEYLGHKVQVGWLEDTELSADLQPFPPAFERSEKPSWSGKSQEPRRHDRGPRPEGRGPSRPQGRGPDSGRGPRPARDSGAPPKKDGAQAQRQDGPRKQDQKGRGPKPAGKPNRPHPVSGKPSHPQSKPGAGAAELKRRPLNKKQKGGLVEKVSGFFKKLFT